MGLDETGATSHLFGTTRSIKLGNVGEQVYIWRVSLLTGSSYIDTNSLIVRELDQSDLLHASNFVSGIKKTLTGSGSEIHLVLFVESDMMLYYLKGSFTSGSGDHTAVRIYSSLNGVGETFFVGSTTETVGSESDVYQSFTVGWA